MHSGIFTPVAIYAYSRSLAYIGKHRRSDPSLTRRAESDVLLDIAFGENGYYFSVRPLTSTAHNYYDRAYIERWRLGNTTKVARKSLLIKAARPPKFKSRVVRRCFKCGRRHGYLRDFAMCRICFREAANEGLIPGIKKSSW